MKDFRDYSQPFRRRRTRSKKLGVISVICVVCLCVGSTVSEKRSTTNSSSNSSSKSVSDFPHSGKVITTNFASLKNHTFKIGASKKYYLKYATSTTTTSTTAASTSTSPTKPPTTTAKPQTSRTTAATTTTSELPPAPPPTPLVSPSKKTGAQEAAGGVGESQNASMLTEDLPQPQPLIQELDLEIPDQIAQGSDHQYMNVLAPPSSAMTGADERSDGFMSPTSSANLPHSYEKFGVQDSLYYKNGVVPSAPTAAAGPSGAYAPSGGAGQNFGSSGPSLHQNFSPGGPSPHQNFGSSAPSPNQNFSPGGTAPYQNFNPGGTAPHQHYNPGGPSPHQNFESSGPHQHFSPGGPSPPQSFSPGGPPTHQNFVGSPHSNFGGNAQAHPARLATTFQQSGGFTGASNFNSLDHHGTPPQPTSGGAYQFPTSASAGGLHEINPFAGSGHHSHSSPNPNVQTFSPYSTLVQNDFPNTGPQSTQPTHAQNSRPTKSKKSKSKSHYHGNNVRNSNGGATSFPASSPSAPSKFSTVNSMPSYSQPTHPSNPWQPSTPKHRGPVYPGRGGPTRRSDRGDKSLTQQQQPEKSDEDSTTDSSQMEGGSQFGSPNNFGPSGSTAQVQQEDPSFLGSFEAGDLPQVVDAGQQENYPSQSPEEFGPAPPDPTNTLHPQFDGSQNNGHLQHHSPVGGSPDFNGFDPSSSPGFSAVDGSQGPQANQQNYEAEMQNLQLDGPPLDEFSAQPMPHQHAPQLNAPGQQQRHQPSSHKNDGNGFHSLSSIEQGFGDINGFTGSTIPLSESAQANSGQEDITEFDNFQSVKEPSRGSPKKLKGSHNNVESSPQFPSPQGHFDISQGPQGPPGLRGFHNAPNQGPGQNSHFGQGQQGFGDFAAVNGGQQHNHHNAQPNGFNSGFGGFPGQEHNGPGLPQPQALNGFEEFSGHGVSHPNQQSGHFNTGNGGNSLSGFQGFGSQLDQPGSADSGSTEGGEATGEVEGEPPQQTDGTSDDESQGEQEQGGNFGAVSDEGDHGGANKQTQRQPSGGFGGPSGVNQGGAPPHHLQGQHPSPGFGVFSNGPSHNGQGPSQHNSRQPTANFGGFSNDPSNIRGLPPQNSHDNSGFGGFPKGPTLLKEVPNQNSLGQHSDFNGFPGGQINAGSPPNQQSQSHFGGFAGPNGLGPGANEHPSGQSQPGFGGFAGSNGLGPGANEHPSGQSQPGFGGFSGLNHLGSPPLQNGPGQPPQGFEGFSGPNHLGSPPSQHTAGQPPLGFGGFPGTDHSGPVSQQAPGFEGFSVPNHHGPPSAQHGPGKPPSGFVGFSAGPFGPPQHAPGQHPIGFGAFPGPHHPGYVPPQHAPIQSPPGFEGFSVPTHFGPPQHAPGQPPPGFGGFSGPNHHGPVPVQHASGQPPQPGFEGFSVGHHPGPQSTPGHPPPGFGGFFTDPNDKLPAFGFFSGQNHRAPTSQAPPGFGQFSAGPNQQGPGSPQNVQGHPTGNVGSQKQKPNKPESPQPEDSPAQQSQSVEELSVEEVQPGPPPSLKQSFSHAPQGQSGNEASLPSQQEQLHVPQSHVSQTGPIIFKRPPGAQSELGQPELSQHPSNDPGDPGFQEFGNFPGRNADLVLNPDESPQNDLHGNQNIGEINPPLNHPPSHSPQVVNFPGPPQVVTFQDPPQVGFQDTETSASNSVEHSIEQQPPGPPGGPGFGQGSPFEGPHHHHHGPQGNQHSPVDDLVKHHPGLGPDDSALVNVPGAGFVGELPRPSSGPPGGPSGGPPQDGFRGGPPFGGPGPIGIGPVGPGLGPIGHSPGGGGNGGGSGGGSHHGHHHKHKHHKQHGPRDHKPGFSLGGLRHAILGPLKLLGGGKKWPLASPVKFFGGVKPINGPLKTFGAPKAPLGPVKGFGGSNGGPGPIKGFGGLNSPGGPGPINGFGPLNSPGGPGPIKGFGPLNGPGGSGPIKGFGPIKSPIASSPAKALESNKYSGGGPIKGFIGEKNNPLGPPKGFGVGIGHGGGPLKGFGLLKGLLDDKGKFPLDHKLKAPVAKVIKFLLLLGDKILSFYANLSIPKDHYIRVISFAGIYLLLGFIFKDSEHLLYPKCEKWGWNPPQEFTFHAPARFVPAVPVDQHMQQEFLDLFRGVENCLDEQVEKHKKKKKKKDKKRKRDKDKKKGNGNSSSEEDEEEDDKDDNESMEADLRTEIDFINDKCPRRQFFYSMSPYHIEAWNGLARLFVEQKTPGDVLHLARTLLHDHSINPKVWYLGLQAAALQRPDMTGFQLAHPIDAMPDWFIPGHLIDHEMERYRGLIRVKRSTMRINRTALSKISRVIRRIYKRTGVINLPISNATRTSTTTTSTTTTTTTTTKRPLILERGHVLSLQSNNSAMALTYGKSRASRERKGDDEDSDEDDEIDENDYDDSDERESRRKKKHPWGYGHGTIGDGYGTYKNKQQNGNNGGGGGGGLFGGLFGGDNRGKGKDKSKEKGKGKGKGKKKDKKKCIIVDGSVGLDNGIENKLWYWREDMMLNQHHWYWHQNFPINATRHGDRRAELFFYFHRNILARYNSERFSNGFARTVELGMFPGSPIEEGYNSHLKDFNSGSWWSFRPPHTPISDILHIHDPDFGRDILVNDVIGLYNSFVKGIKIGRLLTAKGKLLPIRFHEGIQPLADTIEATNQSVNPLYYDAFGLHNLGHLMVGLAQDPDYSKKLPSGVMVETAVSMRDPAFYTYHTMLDNLFEKFKRTLPPYRPYGGVWPLQWHGVDVVDIKLVSHGGGDANHLTTFYIKHKFQLEPGVDRSIAKGIEKAEICAVHLDHAPFQFQISIDRKKCAKSKSGQGTVRIFMAPRYNEEGHRLPLAEQRRLMFQLDAFQVELKVGRNLITRNSRDNSLTKPWSRSLKDYERGPDPSGAADYCGCGWPHHLFIPKGNVEGMAFDLFVMVTNFDEDFVADHPADLEVPERCNSPYIFCGMTRRRYPDSRPMGYPFDRPPYHVPSKPCGHGYGFTLKDVLCKITGRFLTRPAATLEEYVSGATNMAMTVFEIKHIPKVVGKHYG